MFKGFSHKRRVRKTKQAIAKFSFIVKNKLIDIWLNVILESVLYHAGLIHLHPVKKLRVDAITKSYRLKSFIFLFRQKMPFKRRIELSILENRSVLVLAAILFFINPFFSLPLVVFSLAVAFDAVSSDKKDTGGDAYLEFAHTCSGSNRALFVCVGTNANRSIPSVTYDSVSMTKEIEESGGGTSAYGLANIWKLVAPSTGSNTVRVNVSSANAYLLVGAVSFTGTDQTDPVDVSDGASFTGTATINITLTTTVVNTIILDCFSGLSDSGGTPDGSQTLRWAEFFSNTLSAGGSTKAEAAIGDVTMEWTRGSSDNTSIVAVAVQPVPPPTTPANVKTINTVAIANEKTVNTVAAASVKTWNTVT